jgi:hypothetical protein
MTAGMVDLLLPRLEQREISRQEGILGWSAPSLM